MRYKDQMNETPIDVTDLNLTAETVETLLSRFHTTYDGLYHYSQPGQPCEIINARVTVVGKSRPVSFKPTRGTQTSPHSTGDPTDHPAEVGQRRALPVYPAEHLGGGHVIDGPAIVEEPDTSIVVFPGWRLEVAEHPAYF